MLIIDKVEGHVEVLKSWEVDNLRFLRVDGGEHGILMNRFELVPRDVEASQSWNETQGLDEIRGRNEDTVTFEVVSTQIQLLEVIQEAQIGR